MDGWMEGSRKGGRDGGGGRRCAKPTGPRASCRKTFKGLDGWMDWWRERWTCGEGCMDLWIYMSIWILGYYKSEMQQCRRVRVLSAQLVFTWLGGGAKHAAWWRGKSCLAGRVVRFHGLIGSLAGCAEHESLPTNQQTRTPMSAPFTTLGVTKSRRGYWSGRRFIRLVSRSEWKASTSLLTCFSTIRSKGWFTRTTQAQAQAQGRAQTTYEPGRRKHKRKKKERVPFSCACVVPVHTRLMLVLVIQWSYTVMATNADQLKWRQIRLSTVSLSTGTPSESSDSWRSER